MTSRRFKPYLTTTSVLSSSPKARLSRSQSHSPTSRQALVDADVMAAQTMRYMNVLADHAACMRAFPRPQDAYQHVIDKGRVLPADTKWPLLDRRGQDDLRHRMEDIIQRSATTIEELPFSESCQIEAKINKLRAERRSRLPARQKTVFRGLVPPPPLPPIERPGPQAARVSVPIEMINSPSVPAILSQLFGCLDPDFDFYYRVHTMELSSDGCQFAVQYEGTRDTIVLIQDELKQLLENSIMVLADSSDLEHTTG